MCRSYYTLRKQACNCEMTQIFNSKYEKASNITIHILQEGNGAVWSGDWECQSRNVDHNPGLNPALICFSGRPHTTILNMEPTGCSGQLGFLILCA